MPEAHEGQLNFGNEQPDAKDEQIASLEESLVKEKDARSEERFLFVLAIVILIDLMIFPSMQTWGAPVAILVLQVLLVVPLARRCGVEEAARLVDRLLEIIGSRNNRDA